MEQEKILRFHMKLRLYYEERNFGPGVAGLMQLVRERGSLSAACQEMHMAGKRGGENGGTTVLTEEGEAFLNKYLQFVNEAENAVAELFEKYYS